MWLLPAEGPSPLHAFFPGCSGGIAPFVPPSTSFREQDFGMGIVLYETVLCWYLQLPDMEFGSLGGSPPCGCCCVHPLELLRGDGWGGKRGRVVAPQGPRQETRQGEYFIPRGDLYGYICSHLQTETSKLYLYTGRFYSSHQLPSSWWVCSWLVCNSLKNTCTFNAKVKPWDLPEPKASPT